MIAHSMPPGPELFRKDWFECLATDEIAAIVLYLVDSGVQPSGAFLDIDIESVADDDTIAQIERMSTVERLEAAKRSISELMRRLKDA